MIIESENDEERNKLKTAMESELNNEIEVSVPKQIDYYLAISDISCEYEKTDLNDKNKKQNDKLRDCEMEIIKIDEIKSYNKIKYCARIKTNLNTHNIMTELQKINIGSERCRIID